MKLLVCTPGRSGSGAMMKFLHNLCKFRLTEKSIGWCKPLNSGYEDPDIFKAHEAFDHRKLKEFKNHIYKFKDTDIIKDPRFLNIINNEVSILKAWYEVYPDVSSLLLYRKPIQIISSFNHSVTDEQINGVHKKLNEYLLLTLSRKRNYGILLYPDWLEDYDLVYETLNRLNIEFDKDEGRRVFKQVVDLSMVHHKE